MSLLMRRKQSCVLLFCHGLIIYCNCRLAGSAKYLHSKLQKIPNNTARVVFQSSKHEHVSPLLYRLKWLPICQRINYKLSSICFLSVTESGPQYLADILKMYIPSRQLRSSSDTRLFQIPSLCIIH